MPELTVSVSKLSHHVDVVRGSSAEVVKSVSHLVVDLRDLMLFVERNKQHLARAALDHALSRYNSAIGIVRKKMKS